MTPRSRLACLLALVALPLAGFGEASTNAPAAAPATKRDPFWPVDYDPVAARAASVPAATQPAAGTPAPEAERKAILQIDNLTEEQVAAIRTKLKVSGIMRFGPDYVARINNQLVGAGDDVAVELEGQQLLFAVMSITKDSLKLEPKR